MNHFDDQAPLSKIGIVAMFMGLLGAANAAMGFVGLFFDFFYPLRLVGDLFLLAIGCLLVWVAAKIACSKIAYKDKGEVNGSHDHSNQTSTRKGPD